MSPVEFESYQGFGRRVTVVAERVTHWFMIDYNGNYGTTIVLDTGKEVSVTDWPTDVEKKLVATAKTN